MRRSWAKIVLMRPLILAAAVLFFIAGCGPSDKEVQQYREEIKALKQENCYLKAENVGLRKHNDELAAKLQNVIEKTEQVAKEEKPVPAENGSKIPHKAEPVKKKPVSLRNM